MIMEKDYEIAVQQTFPELMLEGVVIPFSDFGGIPGYIGMVAR
jgi:hypothetical protein